MTSSSATATEVAAGLREVADWLDAHPQYDDVFVGSAVMIASVTDRDSMAQLARDLGKARKTASPSSPTFYVSRWFGPVEIWAGIPREQVCRPRVVGKRTVPARPAEPEHEEDVIEWECDDPILAPRLESVEAE